MEHPWSYITWWVRHSYTMHSLSEFKPCSWLLFGFRYCKSLSPARLANFATLKLFKMGFMGQINDPCPSSTGTTCFFTLFDCCINGPWYWWWPLDKVWQSKAPGPPPKIEGGERTCSSIPWWLCPSHTMHSHSKCKPWSWLLFVFYILIRYLPPHSANVATL